MMNDLNIIGIAVRTTNQNQQAVEDIGKLWQRFHAENLLGIIPNQLSLDVYAIYTDYQSNYTGEYTTLLGVAVSSLAEVPEGLVGRHFPAEHFRVFTAHGAMPQAVIDTWMYIWQHDQKLKRKYTYDVEVYGANANLGEKSEVMIYIATDEDE